MDIIIKICVTSFLFGAIVAAVGYLMSGNRVRHALEGFILGSYAIMNVALIVYTIRFGSATINF